LFRRNKVSEADWKKNIISHDEERIKELFETSRTIAVVGMKEVTYKPSYYVPKYLLDHGYEIIPVNPLIDQVDGIKAYPDLRSLPGPVDIVDVFRRSGDIMPHAQEAMELRPRAFWMQSGIINKEAAEMLARAGILVVMDRCMYSDHVHFFGRY
jgi:predicted CoA-binding protein